MPADTALLPAAFAALASAHFVALISPGPDFFLIVGHAARRSWSGAAGICFGIAVGNALYIALAIAGWAGIRQNATLYNAIELAGAAYLLWLARQLFRASLKPFDNDLERSASALHPVRQFLAGLGSAILNPKNAVFYLTLMTVILGPAATLKQRVACGIWMVAVVLAWDLALAFCLCHRAVRAGLAKKIPWIERIAAFVLAMLAAAIVLGRLV